MTYASFSSIIYTKIRNSATPTWDTAQLPLRDRQSIIVHRPLSASTVTKQQGVRALSQSATDCGTGAKAHSACRPSSCSSRLHYAQVASTCSKKALTGSTSNRYSQFVSCPRVRPPYSPGVANRTSTTRVRTAATPTR